MFTLSTADPTLMYSTGLTPVTYHYATPILVSPSAIQIIRPRNNDPIPISYSPSRSIAASSVFDVPIRTSRQNVPVSIPVKQYDFSENGRNFKWLGEKLCCKIFEEYLCREVKWNLRPDWLKNPKTKRNLELDLYDERTKIAIEYNGYRHREPAQMERDKLKADMCKNLGVRLIVVPDSVDYVKKNARGEWAVIKRTPGEREALLKSYIVPFLDEFTSN